MAETVVSRRWRESRRAFDVEQIAVATLACLALAAGAWIMYEGRGLIFFYDEWDWVLRRRDGLDGLFRPHNGHFSLVPVLVFKALFATVGVEHYWVYRLAGVLAHLLCVGLLFALVRRHLGVGLALAAAAVLLVLGAAWQVILWPFEISYLCSIAAGLGALLALDRGSRRGDRVAAALVFVALASSGLGLAVACGVLAELLFAPARRVVRRAWVALAPLTLYAVWYVIVLPDGQAKRGNIDAVPGYVGEAAAGAIGAVTGLGLELGRVLLVIAAIVVIRRLVAPGPLPARLIGVLTMGLVYWALVALARADLQEPLASRYVYFGAVIVLLIGVHSARHITLAPRAWILVGLAVGASMLSNLGDLRDGANSLRETTGSLRAALAAVELAGDAVPATTAPESTAAPQVTAGPYRKLVADLGSPVGGPANVLADGPASAVAVDAALARVLGVAALPAGEAGVGNASAEDPPSVVAIGGRARVDGSCVRYAPAGPGAALDVMLPAGGSIVLRDAKAPAELRLRRMSAAFSSGPIGSVAAGGAVELAVPGDRIARPWVLRVSSAGSLQACTGVPR
ncbi:MAG: hypothetical protein ACR2LK_09725 [Solirubrobacteraceae bacterium]